MNKWLKKFRDLKEFKIWNIEKLTLNDRQLYIDYVKKTNYPANVWTHSFDYLWAYTNSDRLYIFKSLINNMLVTFILTKRGRLYLPCLPFGQGTVEKVTDVLKECAEFCYNWNKESDYTHKSTIIPINEAQLNYFNQSEKFKNNFKEERLSGLERHYSVSKLVDLHGKDFAKIRGKINKFNREYPDAIIRRYKPEDYNQVIELGEKWVEKSGKKYNRILDGFYFEPIIKHYKELDHIILVIELDGKIIGMTTGGILPTGQAWGCLTKFIKSYHGISEMLTISMAKELNRLDSSVEFINVGGDLGSKGLAFAKERYRPVLRYKRYCLFYRRDE